jgi:hypothetical protein
MQVTTAKASEETPLAENLFTIRQRLTFVWIAKKQSARDTARNFPSQEVIKRERL